MVRTPLTNVCYIVFIDVRLLKQQASYIWRTQTSERLTLLALTLCLNRTPNTIRISRYHVKGRQHPRSPIPQVIIETFPA